MLDLGCPGMQDPKGEAGHVNISVVLKLIVTRPNHTLGLQWPCCHKNVTLILHDAS